MRKNTETRKGLFTEGGRREVYKSPKGRGFLERAPEDFTTGVGKEGEGDREGFPVGGE